MNLPLIEFPDAMTRNTKVLLVMDVVESVRMMEQDQDDFVRRWQQLVAQAGQQVLPLHGGRIVKSLGDGLMLAFASAQSCVKAAFALQHFSQQANAGLRPERQMHLRMGGHLASFVTDQHDIYGTDVNLTARFATLAGPGELVVSTDLRDCLTAGLDADIEDLGECHLKHVKEPVKAYRVGPAGHAPVVPPADAAPPDFRPAVAVIPFEARSHEPEHFVIGELVADGIIAQMSRSADLRVISRLSTTAFRGRASPIAEVESRLAASFVLSGSYVVSGSKILILAELADARKDQVIWAGRLSGDTMDLLQAQSELINNIASSASSALIDAEVQQSLAQPLPRLDSGALLLGGITLMHRSSLRDFDRSRQVLEALLERHNRAATPRAWLAKWYTMRVIRGMSDKPGKDTQLALEQTRRALDLAPDNALSLAIEGYARCQLSGEAEVARECIERAIQLNPNEPLGWLYKSVWSSMWGSTVAAVTEAERAAQLSPIDPLKYFFDVILASGQAINGDYDKAIEVAQRSLRANRHHQPTLRVLLHAQVESEQLEEARLTLDQLLREAPNLTVSSYLAMGSSASPARKRLAMVLRKMGVPET
ncbi:MAG: tetratricopeptide repeat protein [Polaromonas sp.]|nr:tetratricopeptide repeat protein [Polaromonas sp.]